MPKKDIYNNLAENIGLENFKTKQKKFSKIKNTLQVGLTSVICMTSVATMVFAQNISGAIYDNYFDTGNGVGAAIQNGYIEEVKTDDTNSESIVENQITGKKVDGVDTKIKIDEFVMDDFSLSITFDVTLSDKIEEVIPIDKVRDMYFPDMLIYDENNNILFYQIREDVLQKFCSEKNLDSSKYTSESDKIINSGVNCYVKERNKNHVKVLYNIYTGGDDTYPKSKKINAYMSQIRISEDVETAYGEEEILLQGKWDFGADVPEKMYNRQSVAYQQIKTTNEDFKVTKAMLYDTGMKIGLNFPAKRVERYITPEIEFYESLPDDDELKTIEILNYLENKFYNSDEYMNYIKELMETYNFEKYIINEKGEKFELTVGPSENGSSYINDNNIMEFEGMFDVTKYNSSDELVVHINYKGQEADITLRKVVE